ncbi:MAG TPA: hypothetical protein VGQ57_11455, partial [Polyangiaceae bacterium]|nr:hypothetical protein [Polyangiaceae bacterium]
MSDLRPLAVVLGVGSVFLVNCSSGDDDTSNNAGTGGTSNGMAGTGGAAAGKGGASGSTSVAGTGGAAAGTTSGAAGTSSKAGSGGAGGQGGVAAGGQAGAGPKGGGAGKGSAGVGASGGTGPSGGVGGGSGAAGTAGSGAGAGGKAGGGAGGTSSTGMTLTSSVLTEGGMFPDTITCAGTNQSPDLTWTAGPSGTMSYAVVLLDTSNMLTHWAMWDIPSSVTMLPAALDTMANSTTVPGAKQKSFSGSGYA